MSNNISLKYLFDQQNLNYRQTNWLSLLSEYDFKIKHTNEKKNADALIHHTNILFVRSSYESYLENHILNAKNSNKEY